MPRKKNANSKPRSKRRPGHKVIANTLATINAKLTKVAGKVEAWSVDGLAGALHEATAKIEYVVAAIDDMPSDFRPTRGSIGVGDTVFVKAKYAELYASMIGEVGLVITEVKGAHLICETENKTLLAIPKRYVEAAPAETLTVVDSAPAPTPPAARR